MTPMILGLFVLTEALTIVTMSVLQKKCQIYFGLSIILLQRKVRAICTCIKEDSELPTVFESNYGSSWRKAVDSSQWVTMHTWRLQLTLLLVLV